jgi:hypothetical protein
MPVQDRGEKRTLPDIAFVLGVVRSPAFRMKAAATAEETEMDGGNR